MKKALNFIQNDARFGSSLEGQGGKVYGRSQKCVKTYFFMLKCRFWGPAGHPQKFEGHQKASKKFNTATFYLPGPASGHPKLPKLCVSYRCCENLIFCIDFWCAKKRPGQAESLILYWNFQYFRVSGSFRNCMKNEPENCTKIAPTCVQIRVF